MPFNLIIIVPIQLHPIYTYIIMYDPYYWYIETN